ncbi:phosphoribosylglycinamide formyltransferase [Willisornis vidua]|uniref:Phosphoribosylglycinamide formyltransferase n=1 Tax=Willisornis vidua TaxID=1566151 RepID=A0ABQ9DS27_9PASS|nr:phosphoribosylglycinamide formyltransferase [Willisornis vidua]
MPCRAVPVGAVLAVCRCCAAVPVSDHAALAQFCRDQDIKLVVVGPEVPLAAGVVDDLTAAGISASFPALVVKASGLAAGKGVIVASSKAEACKAVTDIMQDKSFGTAGETVVVEELLEGEEISISKDLLQQIRDTVLQKTVDGMRKEGVPYLGVLYAGLMLTKDGPKVLEFNCRFGDPECQVILPLLKSDLYEVLQAVVTRRLSSSLPVWLEDSAAVTVIMASQGYPGAYPKGLEITGLAQARQPGLEVFHAGTALQQGRVVTSGGRVLAVTAVGTDLPSALRDANAAVGTIRFQGAQFRRDIGHHAIAFLRQSRGLTYKNSGVDIAAGNTLVQQIKPLAAATSRAGCNAELGGFAGLFDLKAAGYRDPILVSGTDGVGTKLKVNPQLSQPFLPAELLQPRMSGTEIVSLWECAGLGPFTSLGQEALPALVCLLPPWAGAQPCAGSEVSSPFIKHNQAIHAAAKAVLGHPGVKSLGCQGGETAEMPGMYPPGEYDLAGFAVGAVERGHMLPQLDRICPGDVVIGVASSGVHSNGFSLVRKIVEKSSLDFSSPVGVSGDQTLGELLLTPTKLYSKTLLPVLRSGHVKAFAHITGGGLLENIPRVLPDTCGVVLGSDSVKVHNLLRALQANRSLSVHSHIQGKVQAGKVRVAVLISGTALLCPALSPAQVIEHTAFPSRAAFDSAVDEALREFSVELICLAGFMRILSGPFVKKWEGKILNIHPSLLPSFKGANAHQLVLQAGVRVTGCTVHFVAEEVDAGAIIFQEAVPVKVGDTEQVLAERVKEAEHRAFPAALQLVASGAVSLGEAGKICWK